MRLAQRPISGTDSRQPARRKRHGLTADRIAALRARQGGRCAICRRLETPDSRMHLDHDHRHCPGKYGCERCVRGLLCPRCNQVMKWVDAHRERLLVFIRAGRSSSGVELDFQTSRAGRIDKSATLADLPDKGSTPEPISNRGARVDP